MTDAELDAIFETAKTKVRVACDEAHNCTALHGCLSGDEQAVTICKLVEVIRKERTVVREAVARIGAKDY